MIKIKFFLSIILSLITFSLLAQESKPTRYTASNTGKFFVSWGGNRTSFTNSDITFKGADYDFTLTDVKSHDKPKGWHIDYINPGRMTIPQTNAKIGYFINEHYTVAIGLDHMKYVMTQNQTAQIDGDINMPITEPGAVFNGSYNNVPIQLTEDFLKFEHTDGLNFIYSEFSRFDDISSLFNIKNTDVFQVNITEGIGAGVLYPKTNATLLSKERHDDFHISGYGVALSAGLHLNFFKYFYIRGDLKGGFIDMNKIRTTKSGADSASQSFFYLQRVLSLGGIFRL